MKKLQLHEKTCLPEVKGPFFLMTGAREVIILTCGLACTGQMGLVCQVYGEDTIIDNIDRYFTF